MSTAIFSDPRLFVTLFRIDSELAEMTQAQCLVHDVMPWVKKNLWWHPYGPEVYQGLRGMLDLLYGRGLWRRMTGLKALVRAFPRTFKSS